jgi:hypothetical protein
VGRRDKRSVLGARRGGIRILSLSQRVAAPANPKKKILTTPIEMLVDGRSDRVGQNWESPDFVQLSDELSKRRSPGPIAKRFANV